MTFNGRPRSIIGKCGQDAKDTLVSLLAPHAPSLPLHGPLKLDIVYLFPFNKGTAKHLVSKGFMFKGTRPDFDNMSSTIMDVLTTLRFWQDDSQAVMGNIIKGYAETPGILLNILPIEEDYRIEVWAEIQRQIAETT